MKCQPSPSPRPASSRRKSHPLDNIDGTQDPLVVFQTDLSKFSRDFLRLLLNQVVSLNCGWLRTAPRTTMEILSTLLPDALGRSNERQIQRMLSVILEDSLYDSVAVPGSDPVWVWSGRERGLFIEERVEEQRSARNDFSVDLLNAWNDTMPVVGPDGDESW